MNYFKGRDVSFCYLTSSAQEPCQFTDTPTFLFSSWGKERTPPLPLSLLSSSSLLCPPLPVGIGALNLGLGRAVSSPSGVWCEAPVDKRFGAYWSQKVQLWWQQFLLIFLRTNVIFCTKAILVQFLTGRRAMRSFFLVRQSAATIALWKPAARMASPRYCNSVAGLSEMINISFAQIEQYAHLHRYSWEDHIEHVTGLWNWSTVSGIAV